MSGVLMKETPAFWNDAVSSGDVQPYRREHSWRRHSVTARWPS